ncbi:MAG: glycosyltransferase [Candidatus Hydrogenedentes bacterium]|nr:glycosyltransferase [Candidatus Hydrogenedentota bacterium]
MSSISAVLIVKNEAHRLAACLEALRAVADEIVVLDTGSTDETEETALGFTGKVHHFAWRGDFAAARNAAVACAAGDWVISIDADEVMEAPADARARLVAFAAEHDPSWVGTIELFSPTGPGADAAVVRDRLERFFHRGVYRFEGVIHEQLVPAAGGAKRAAATGVRVRHFGYAQAADAPDHKALRNIPLLRRALDARPDDEYLLHQLGKAHFSLRQYAAAAVAFEQALAAIRFAPGAPPQGRDGPVARVVLSDLVITLAYTYANLNRTVQSLQLLERHAALAHPGVRCADFPHALGYVHLMLGHVAESKAAYERSLEWGGGAEDVLGTGSFSSEYHLGLLSEAENDVPAAWRHYAAALRHKADYRPVLSRCVGLAAERGAGMPEEILRVADRTALEQLLTGQRRGVT